MGRRGYKLTYARSTSATKNSCGKVAYSDRADAEDAAEHRTKKAVGPQIRAYWCPRCFNYHLTSKPIRP